ncbi:hypothetical protein FJY84_04640 [Candidatus Bathyarchaeota archaeon]|nr:hypothetical protein [Candidatus Bathyarchaeota archaeon]
MPRLENKAKSANTHNNGLVFEIKEIKKFKQFLELNLRLTPSTVVHTVNIAKRYLRHSKGVISSMTLSKYLQIYLKKEAWTYNTQIVALRRFFKFIEMSDTINAFKLAPIDCGTNTKFKVPTLAQVETGFKAQTSEADRALYTFTALTGLRAGEVVHLTRDKVDLENRTVIPKHYTRTKATGITFLTIEAAEILKEYLSKRRDKNPRVFTTSERQRKKIWIRASEAAGVKITPQILRVWFSSEMGERGVPDRYVDIFQGRAPRSVIAKSYTGIELSRLRGVYDRAGLKF